MGPVWLAGGGFATLSSVTTLLNPSSSINIDGAPSSDISTKVLGVAIPLFVTIMGWLFIRTSKYYPPNS